MNSYQMQSNKKLPTKKDGRWTKAENKIFFKALEKYGRNWTLVQKKVKTRSLTQIRSHAYKLFMHVPEQDLDAFIGYDGPEIRQNKTEFGRQSDSGIQKRISPRVLDKKENHSPRVFSETPISNQSAKIKEQELEKEQPIRKFPQLSNSENLRERNTNLDSSSTYSQNSGMNSLLKDLQMLENDQFNGNFLHAVVHQLAINNALRMLHIFPQLAK